MSSALAAPAYAGIPLTARGIAASVAIVTGHCATEHGAVPPVPAADTVVVLMGIANAAALCAQLISAGRDGNTPAAVIEWGTCATQRVAVATLATLPDVIACDSFRAPAVLVIGEVVRLRSVLEWFEPDAAIAGARLDRQPLR